MMKIKFIIAWAVIGISVSAPSVFAQTSPAIDAAAIPIESAPPFALGDQYFSIHAGGYFPLFLINPQISETTSTNQTIGGAGSIQWNIYLNQYFSVGAETAYIFAFTPNSRLFTLWPTSIKVGFAPRIGQFLIPVHIDIGMVFSYLEESTKLDLLLKGGVGFYWFFESAWALGVRAEYYFIPQIYNGTIAPSSDTRILNSLTASIGVLYKL